MRDHGSCPDDASMSDVGTRGASTRGRILALSTFILGCAWPLACPPAHAAETVAMLPIKLLDTSGEPTNQTTDHKRRLEALGSSLARDLTKAGVYNVIEVPAADLEKECPSENAKCLLSAARQKGASLMLIGVVHKSSSLIMQMFARLYDVKAEKEVFSRDLNFRGDNDESWRRVEAFLIDQFELAIPRKQANAPSR